MCKNVQMADVYSTGIQNYWWCIRLFQIIKSYICIKMYKNRWCEYQFVYIRIPNYGGLFGFSGSNVVNRVKKMYLMGCYTCCILLKYLFVNLQLSSFQKAKPATLLVQSSNSEIKHWMFIIKALSFALLRERHNFDDQLFHICLKCMKRLNEMYGICLI